MEALHAIAESDTPSKVQVPQTLTGLLVWAIGRFGGIVVATAFLAYAWNDSNEANKKQTERLIVILEGKSKTDTELSGALLKLSVAINEVAAEARAAHGKYPRPSSPN